MLNSIDLDCELEFNLFGRLSGNEKLICTNKELLLVTKTGALTLINFKHVQDFVDHEKAIFGNKIHVGNDVFRFLSKTRSSQFANSINQRIALNIEPHICTLIRKFQTLVIRQYPRDSTINIIQKVVGELERFLVDEKVPWNKFNNKNLKKNMKSIINLKPITQENLGKLHESIYISDSTLKCNVFRNAIGM